jgi:Undecaprenyl-phosphate glucose phosphotransferase
MLKKHSQLFEGVFSAVDLIVVSAAWMLSYTFRFSLGLFPVDKGIPPWGEYFKMLIFVGIIWAFVFRRAGLYRPMRGGSRLREIWTVAKVNSLCVLLFLATTYLFQEKSVPFSRLVFVIFWSLSTVFTVSARAGLRQVLRAMRRRGYNQRYAVIVGSGALASQVAARMMFHPEFGIKLLGCLDSRDNALPPTRRVLSSFKNASGPQQLAAQLEAFEDIEELRDLNYEPDLPIVGVYEDLPELLSKGFIDQVIIALPLKDHDMLESVIASIGDSIVDVKIVPDVHRFIQLGSSVEEFDGLPVVSLASTPLAGFSRVIKRAVDVVLGSILLLITLPLMLLIAILVKMTSRGSVFFGQERVGLDGQTFTIYKFRTMTVDAEVDGARFAVRNDPRVTTLGRILRKLSLDELPQLINVLQGKMSLVGPRPERPVFIEEFRRRVPKYMLRHKVQAGMTGWAQVNGWRGNTSIEKRIEHDLYYIEHWSFMLDLKILWLTLFRAVADRNAY